VYRAVVDNKAKEKAAEAVTIAGKCCEWEMYKAL